MKKFLLGFCFFIFAFPCFAQITATPTRTMTPVYVNPTIPHWKYSTSGNCVVGTPGASTHVIVLTGSSTKIVAINRIKGAVGVYIPVPGITSASQCRIAVCSPDSTPVQSSQASIRTFDTQEPPSDCAATVNSSAPASQGPTINTVSIFSILTAVPFYMTGFTPITITGTINALPATLVRSPGESNNFSPGSLPTLWDDNAGTSPIILRGINQCLSIQPLSTSANEVIFYSIEWTEF